MCISCTVTDICSVEYCRDLETWVRGSSRSLKMTPNDRSCTTYYHRHHHIYFATLYVWSAMSTTLSVTVFKLLYVEEYRDLEIHLNRHLRSLEMAWFDRSHTSFYSHSTATMSLPRSVSETLSVE